MIAGAVAAGPIKQYFYPSNGNIYVATLDLTVVWADSLEPVTTFNWGTVENNTAYVMDAMNITNIGDTNVTLTLNTTDWSVSIIDLQLTMDYTGILLVNESVIVELEQTINATGPWSYNTVITAEAA